MATEILLTSEAFVKSVSNISDNVAGKYLRPSIREAQEIKMRTIVGDALLDKLKALVEDNTIGEVANAAYKTLVDRAQYFLAYSAIVELVPKVTFKIANAGSPSQNSLIRPIAASISSRLLYEISLPCNLVNIFSTSP